MRRSRRILATSSLQTRKDRLRQEKEGPSPRTGTVCASSSILQLAVWELCVSLAPKGGNCPLMAEVKVKVQPPDADPVEIENR